MTEILKKYIPFIGFIYWIVQPIILIFVWYVLDMFSRRIARRFHEAAREGIKVRVPEGAEQRAAMQRSVTIYYLLRQLLRGVVGGVMIFWLLGSIGIDMRPVIAGVGVAGLALSFAAQNIVRDYLNGFFILFEDQFNIGDYITAGDASGTVESFSLRATRMRDIYGNLITIPNSAILSVKNFNKGWAVALVEINISYDADYKKAMEIAVGVARAMSRDPSCAIIEEPVVQGILDFKDNAVVLRAVIKTEAGQQWAAGRTFRLLLKEAFDKNQIRFAYPRMVMHEGAPPKQDEEK